MRAENYYTAAAVRELDRLAIEEHHIAGFKLMQLAGTAAFHALMKKWPDVQRLVIFCGTGNNGGDGFIVAGLAQKAGLEATVYLTAEIDRVQGDAARALQYALNMRVTVLAAEELLSSAQRLPESEKTVLVDALLGTGLTGDIRAPFDELIKLINESGLPVLAIDIPSGLSSDHGTILGNAVKADLTVTFIGRKIGQITGAGPGLCGELIFDDLGVPADIYSQVTPEIFET